MNSILGEIARLVAILGILVVASCSPRNTAIDLSSLTGSDEVLSRGYRVGQVYQTRTALLVTGRKKLSLSEPGGSEPFVKQYIDDPASFKNVVGIVQTGTDLRISRVEMSDSGMGGIVNAYAILLNGKFKEQEVFLRGVSRFEYGTQYGSVSMPDEEWLQLKR
ncbi:hypothetical protein [Haloferula helveola]|uniref:hypothetical protein n=1 Tax=Haloferula helveola TaxID=490095 RepID=UPI0030CB21C4